MSTMWRIYRYLATLLVNIGPRGEEDVHNVEVSLPAGGEQGAPLPPVQAVHVCTVQQQHLHRIEQNYQHKAVSGDLLDFLR